MATTKTVKARIALAIDSNGDWNAFGWGTEFPEAPEMMMDNAVNGVDSMKTPTKHWIEVEVPIPDEVAETLQGRVTGDEADQVSLHTGPDWNED